jgi:hypothetical protein
MNIIGKAYWWWMGSGVLAQYQALLDKASDDGVTLPSATRAADQAFITELIDAGVWEAADRIGVHHFNDVNLKDFSLYNWKDPDAFELSHIVSEGTDSALGWNWDGSTNAGDTNFNPATQGVKYLLNDASRFAYIEAAATIGTVIDGNEAGVNNKMLNENSTLHRINSGNVGALDLSGTGLKGLSQVSNSLIQGWSGTTKTDLAIASTSVTSANQNLARAGTGGGVIRSNALIGFHFMGGALSEAQVLALRTAILTRRTAIGL